MAKPYDLRERSFIFACDVVHFCEAVAECGYVMRRLAGQLIDAGGSVGANLAESVSAQSKPDYIAKSFIALKETREARFWLRLIAASRPSFQGRAAPLIAESSELVAILTAGLKTARSNPSRGS